MSSSVINHVLRKRREKRKVNVRLERPDFCHFADVESDCIDKVGDGSGRQIGSGEISGFSQTEYGRLFENVCKDVMKSDAFTP